MKFTFWAVGAPFVLAVFAAVMSYPSHGGGPWGITTMIWGPWLLVGIPATVIYWIVRLARRAWRDGVPQGSQRPSGWIYPDERP
jgi:hypothetical protein